MKDRTFLVMHNGSIFTFPGEQVREMLTFATKKLGRLNQPSRETASKLLEQGIKMFESDNPHRQKLPVRTLMAEGGRDSVDIYLANDGLEAAKDL